MIYVNLQKSCAMEWVLLKHAVGFTARAGWPSTNRHHSSIIIINHQPDHPSASFNNHHSWKSSSTIKYHYSATQLHIASSIITKNHQLHQSRKIITTHVLQTSSKHSRLWLFATASPGNPVPARHGTKALGTGPNPSAAKRKPQGLWAVKSCGVAPGNTVDTKMVGSWCRDDWLMMLK